MKEQEQNDDRLIDLARGGDEQAFTQLLEKDAALLRRSIHGKIDLVNLFRVRIATESYS